MGYNNTTTVWVWVGCFYSACFNYEGSLDFCELSCDLHLKYVRHEAGMVLESCPCRVCGTGVGTGVGFSTDVFPWSERQWGKTKPWICDAVALVGSDAIRSSPNCDAQAVDASREAGEACLVSLCGDTSLF